MFNQSTCYRPHEEKSYFYMSLNVRKINCRDDWGSDFVISGGRKMLRVSLSLVNNLTPRHARS